jgi:hypothetical protein
MLRCILIPMEINKILDLLFYLGLRLEDDCRRLGLSGQRLCELEKETLDRPILSLRR